MIARRVLGTMVAILLVMLIFFGLGKYAIAVGMNDEHAGPANARDFLHVALFFLGLAVAMGLLFIVAMLYELVCGFSPGQLIEQERDRGDEFFDER